MNFRHDIKSSLLNSRLLLPEPWVFLFIEVSEEIVNEEHYLRMLFDYLIFAIFDHGEKVLDVREHLLIYIFFPIYL